MHCWWFVLVRGFVKCPSQLFVKLCPCVIFWMHANTHLTSMKRVQRWRQMLQADSLLSQALCFPNRGKMFKINMQCSTRYIQLQSADIVLIWRKLHNHLRVAHFNQWNGLPQKKKKRVLPQYCSNLSSSKRTTSGQTSSASYLWLVAQWCSTKTKMSLSLND